MYNRFSLHKFDSARLAVKINYSIQFLNNKNNNHLLFLADNKTEINKSEIIHHKIITYSSRFYVPFWPSHILVYLF